MGSFFSEGDDKHGRENKVRGRTGRAMVREGGKGGGDNRRRGNRETH